MLLHYTFFLQMLLCMIDLDQSLLSMEKLDRASPDIWPERNCNFFQILRFSFCNFSYLLYVDPGIEYVIEPPTSPEIQSPQSIIPQELDKHDYTLIGSKFNFIQLFSYFNF